MEEQHARAIQEAEIQAVITRCTCGTPQDHVGLPCPQGRQEVLGTIAYWHKDPIHRLWWSAKEKLKEIRHG